MHIRSRGLLPAYLLALACARPTLAAWQVEAVEDGPYAVGVSLRFDGLDRPHLAYGGDRLYHAVKDGATWTVEVVDPTPNIGTDATIRFDASGEPHLSYRPSYGAASVLHAERRGGFWTTELAADYSHTGGSGGIAVDAAGGLFVYASGPTSQMKVARRQGATWTVDSIDSGSMGQGGIASSSQGRVFASYHFFNPTLKLATWDGTTWTTQVVDSATDYEGGSAVAADSAGRPLVAFRDSTSMALKLARWNGTSWTQEVVDANGTLSRPSLAVDGADHPIVSYVETGSSTLRVAIHDGSSWTVQGVSVAPEMAGAHSLALDSGGRPAVAYIDVRTGDLALRRWDGTGWTREVVVVNRATWSGRLAVDAAGNPVLAYQVPTGGNEIRWARWTGTDWDRRPVPGTFSPGYPWYFIGSMMLDPAANPILAMIDPFPPPQRAADLVRWDGTSWTWETVSDAGSSGVIMDLDAAGHPVLVYSNASNTSMVVARFDGSAWSFAAGPPLGSNPGVTAALRLTRAGDPVIVYSYDQPSVDEARLARWNGSGWDVETLWSGSNEQLLFSFGLALDDQDRPLVAFSTFENIPPNATNSRVMRWTGTAWESDVLSSTTADIAPTLDAVIFDRLGRPRALGWDVATGSLELATYEAGAWQRATLVSGLWSARAYRGSMQLDRDGVPMVLFEDQGEHALKLVRWSAVPLLIRRGPDPAALPPLVSASLPWTDPDPVLTPIFPSLLFYGVDGVGRIALTKAGTSVRVDGL